MKHYQKAFGTQHMPPATWFDFEVDTLYLDWGFAYKTKSRCDHYAFGPGHIGDCAEKVKKLALWDNYIINYTIEDDGSPFEEWLRGVLVEFKHLDELVLVDRYHLNTEVQRKDLVMLDEVIAIKDAMEIFKEEKGKPYSEEKTALVQKEHQFWRERSKRMTPAEKKDLEARRRSDDDWDVPKVVSWKTITTNGRLEKYKKAVEAYEMKKFADASTIEAEVEEESESEEEPETESEPDEFDDTYDSDDSDEPMTNED
ncbi:uncharacterized protein LY89DRAFT_690372 [Mollisia scopiformis]|uniref:Uncharacterized protein n=1 Tax=Mollisia scopiformis TaxID=149040 RepID=A0A132BAM5_MOLSC|nr:uncharacterized protein LY89DRAFT_690372 [Mollisia scopiformis]KUJ09323.1 hypothetical protein LY89DRAFT_690372 [Mollisia scopiformis]